MSFRPPYFLSQSVTVVLYFPLHFLPHKSISAWFISLSNRKKDNVTKIGRIHIMSQDLIHWAIGIPPNTVVSKYAYSELIISRDEDPKWWVPSLLSDSLSSPPKNLWNQGIAFHWGWGLWETLIEVKARAHRKQFAEMRHLLLLIWGFYDTAGGRFEVSAAALFQHNRCHYPTLFCRLTFTTYSTDFSDSQTAELEDVVDPHVSLGMDET